MTQEPHREETQLPGEQHLVGAETLYTQEVTDLQTAIESGEDPTTRAEFLLYLIEGSVDPELSGDERKRALGSAVAKVYSQMSEPVREVFAKAAGMDLVPNDDEVTGGPLESNSSGQPKDDAGTATPGEPELTPLPTPEITADINGSKVRVIDPDEIVRVALRDGVALIYDKSNFGGVEGALPTIARLSTTVRPAEINNQSAIKLTSVVELSKPAPEFRNFEFIKRRFQELFPNQNSESQKDTDHDGLMIYRGVFGNSYIVKDSNGSVFHVLVGPNSEQIIITNNFHNNAAGNPDIREDVNPTPLSDIPAAEQLKSLGRVTAVVADLTTPLNKPREGQTWTPEEWDKWALEYRLNRKYTFDANSVTDIVAELDNAEARRFTGKESVSFNDIGGYDGVKRQLENAALMLSNPDIARKWGSKPPNGILLYGPPGTGKTMLAEAFAHEIGADFVQAGSTEIYDMWMGNSGKNLIAIFDKARAAEGRVVLFFDEIESFISKSTYDDTRNDIAGIFKTEMTKLAVSNPNIIVVAATNDLDRLDPSIVRPGRFDKKIEVPLPNDKDRTDIIAVLIAKSDKAAGGFRIFAEGIVPVELVNVSDGFSGADIVEVLNRLKVEGAIREANHEPVTPISQQEILEEMGIYREEKESQRRLDD